MCGSYETQNEGIMCGFMNEKKAKEWHASKEQKQLNEKKWSAEFTHLLTN